MEQQNYVLVQEEVAVLTQQQKDLVKKGEAVWKVYDAKLASCPIPYFQYHPAQHAKSYESRLHHGETLVYSAAAQLRHLRDVTVPRDRGDEVTEESRLVAQLAKEARESVSPPYPSEDILPMLRQTDSTLAELSKEVQISHRTLLEEISTWEISATSLGRAARDKMAIAEEAGHIPTDQLSPLRRCVEDVILTRLRDAGTKLSELMSRWDQRLADVNHASALFAPVVADAHTRDEVFQDLRERAAKMDLEVQRLVRFAEETRHAEVKRLHGLALEPRSQLPVVGQQLQSITSIFSIKPPPTATSHDLATTQSGQTWWNTQFAAVLNSTPAIQLLHLYHPFQTLIPHLVVLGDDVREAARSAALVASAHVRAGRKVTVYMPSKGVNMLLQDAVHRQHFDVNLQQLVSGLERHAPTTGEDLVRLNAVYKTHVLQDCGTQAPSPEVADETYLYLLLAPGQLPSAWSVTPGVRSIVFLRSIAPHGALVEALRALRLQEQQKPGRATRSAWAASLAGRVFQLPDERLRNPTEHMIRVEYKEQDYLTLTTLDDVTSRIGAGVPLSIHTTFLRDADIRSASLPAQTLLHTVMEADRRHAAEPGFLQGIYIGGDGHQTNIEYGRTLLRMFRDRFGYTDPDVGPPGMEEARAVATCSSLTEWERLMTLRDHPAILIFPRIDDPAFALAVRGQVGIFHLYTPVVAPAEQKRVLHQFVPVSIIRYQWPQAVKAKIISLLPRPIGLTDQIGVLAAESAINRVTVVRQERHAFMPPRRSNTTMPHTHTPTFDQVSFV